MTTAEERQARALENIARELPRITKTMEAALQTSIEIGRLLKNWTVGKQHEEAPDGPA